MKLRSSTFLLLALVAPIAHAADKDVEDMLKILRTNYSNAKSVRMDVVGVLDQLGDENPLTSKIWYRKPGAFRMETKGNTLGPNNTLLLISDGKQTYMKNPAGQVTKEKFDPDKIATPVNLETLCFWDWKRQLSTDKGANMHDSQLRLIKKETWKDKDYMVLEEKAPKSKVFVRYYIDPKTKFIVRTAVYNLDNPAEMLQDYKVTSFQLNPRVDEKQFKFPS